MMKGQKKTFVSGLFAIIIGSSCCWISSITIWVGGACFVGVILDFAKIPLLTIGFVLLCTTSYKFIKANI